MVPLLQTPMMVTELEAQMRAQAQGGPTGPLGEPSASQPLPRPPPPRGFPQQVPSCLQCRAERFDSINLLQQLCKPFYARHLVSQL